MRAKTLCAQTSLQGDPFGTAKINNPAHGKKARELSETFKLEYLEIANPFMEGRTLSMWVKCTMKVVNLESPLETDTWLLKESGRDSRGRLRPCTHFSSQILENREERKGEKKPGDSQMPEPGLFKSINYFLALFKGCFLMNIYGTGCFQSREGQTLPLLLLLLLLFLFFFLFFFLQQEQKERKPWIGSSVRRRRPPLSEGVPSDGVRSRGAVPPTRPSCPCPAAAAAAPPTESRGGGGGSGIENRAKSAQTAAPRRWEGKGDRGSAAARGAGGCPSLLASPQRRCAPARGDPVFQSPRATEDGVPRSGWVRPLLLTPPSALSRAGPPPPPSAPTPVPSPALPRRTPRLSLRLGVLSPLPSSLRTGRGTEAGGAPSSILVPVRAVRSDTAPPRGRGDGLGGREGAALSATASPWTRSALG